MSTNPWTSGVLPRKFVELVGVALNAACTNLNPECCADMAGATSEEILFVLKAVSLMSIHSCSLGAPILLEEAQAAGVKLAQQRSASTPACDAMRAVGQWNVAWDPFFALDPSWTDQFFATVIPIYKSGVMPPKELELLSIACDASFTHMYAPGVRRHIKAALKLGATMEEIMEVLKLCVVQGVQSCNLGVPILADELAKLST
jgi:alkylhydroperoxidase/carboxymuconolactone decarboxylase family protein YurZ